MKSWLGRVMTGVGVVVLAMVVGAAKGEPIFLRWLNPADPGDQAIRIYWERAQSGHVTAKELVDLGTMLYSRGFPKDAIRVYERAGKADPKLAEPWFRIGLVEHSQGRLRAARHAYKHCLKVLTGHGWCNFYMGLASEQSGRASAAVYYYHRAFRFAPELADPRVNPEVLSSRLAVPVSVRHLDRETFKANMPMSYLQPDEVAAAHGKAPVVEKPAAQARPTAKPHPSKPSRRAQPRVQIRRPTPHPGETSRSRAVAPRYDGGWPPRRPTPTPSAVTPTPTPAPK
ncbi:MAG: tetratricopeptide repeat protein, partial [Acidobacteria bacterium]|nr:tetratricopeptide repeat protein [Acidobacteriota bacterium]